MNVGQIWMNTGHILDKYGMNTGEVWINIGKILDKYGMNMGQIWDKLSLTKAAKGNIPSHFSNRIKNQNNID